MYQQIYNFFSKVTENEVIKLHCRDVCKFFGSNGITF
jgi:hypothetical protein